MRSIDADAIYDTLSDIFIEYLATSSNTDTRNALDSLYHTVLSAVETAPTISPDEVRGVGEWKQKEIINLEDTTIEQMQSACCSVCGKYHTTPFSYYFSKYNYCPNCGAKMEVSEDDQL